MCLGIPGRVVELVDGYAGQLALVDVEGARRRINVGMLDSPPADGDWVLLHMGFALEVIDAAKAGEALSGLEMMGRARDEKPAPGEATPAESAPGAPAEHRLRRRFEVHGVVQGSASGPSSTSARANSPSAERW